jgi:hypothetical protein
MLMPKDDDPKPFVPTGSIVFFLLLIMLSIAIWYTIYFIMLSRV